MTEITDLGRCPECGAPIVSVETTRIDLGLDRRGERFAPYAGDFVQTCENGHQTPEGAEVLAVTAQETRERFQRTLTWEEIERAERELLGIDRATWTTLLGAYPADGEDHPSRAYRLGFVTGALFERRRGGLR